ncbi:MAG: hypothetical protein IPM98_14715 [Lewinellaceae bacterium]|nr:hypothetical protein [Lewinellaceae bacterium]
MCELSENFKQAVTDSKLITLLRALAPRQLSRLGDFLRSPYFNKNRDCLLLFEYLQKYAPHFAHDHLTREKVLEKLVLEKPADDKSLAQLGRKLLTLAEKFLAVEAFLDDPWEQQMLAARQFHVLNLPKHHQVAQAEADAFFENTDLRDAGFFLKKLLTEKMALEQGDAHQIDYNRHLQLAVDALDAYYVAEKLRYACHILNHEAVLNIRYASAHIEDILRWAEGPDFENAPPVQVYSRIALLLKNPEEPARFEQARQAVVQHERAFPADELRQAYTLLLNYCTHRINRHNDERFWAEYLEINKLLLKNRLIFDGAVLPPWRYTNLVNVGLKVGQTDWVWDFLHNHRKQLPPEYTDNVFRYNLAQYHYHQKNYDSAQRALAQVEFTNVVFNITARSLLIKIYWETGQSELLLAYLEATRIFLHRNRLLDAGRKRQMQKFVEITTKLARTAAFDKDRLRALLDQLPAVQEMLHRDWLAAQIRLLLK